MTVALVRPDILCAWKGQSLLVVNTRGQCGSDEPLSGFYFREARFLSTLRLELNGEAPWRCDAASLAPDALAFTFVYPEITEPSGGGSGQAWDEEHTNRDGLPERALDIRVSYRVGIGSLEVEVRIANRARGSLSLTAACVLDADFADIQETQGPRRVQEAPVEVHEHQHRLEFSYRHPELPFRTTVAYDGIWTAKGTCLTAALSLRSQEQVCLPFRIVPGGTAADLTDEDIRQRDAALSSWRKTFARVTVPGNRVVQETLDRNIRDFASFPLLDGAPDEWLVMQAGVPLYPAFFGRDAMTAGWQAGYVDCGKSLDAALTRLGRLQSNRIDDWHDEEPGRIPYQVRTGPLALLKVNPYAAYYADYASPLMYVVALANLYAWTGETEGVRRHWDTARRILDWARDFGDKDRDGYLEYLTRSSDGTKNQGWKDSGDAIVYDDGTPVPAPIATCELQGYWYIAQELASILSAVMHAPEDAAAFRASAADLKRRFNRDWWLEDDGLIALAMDPDKNLVRAPSSNAGHCLACGIVSRDHMAPLVGRMFEPDLFSGWGIRTLSSDHAFYNPLSYHRGTVWAVEQATIVFGLRRFGFDARALDLAGALFDLAALYPEYRVPETVGGYGRGEWPVPGAYPRANTPQLWNATAFPLVVQSLLGLLPLAPIETLVIDPLLPTWIPELVLHDLRVGRARVTLRFWRDKDGRSKWDVLRKHGTLHILRQPPLESVSAAAWDRSKALFESIAR